MKVKKLPDKSITETIKMIDVEGEAFGTGTLMEILNALDGKDGFFTAIHIYNEKIRKKLGKMKVIKTNIRGGSSPGVKFEEFKKIIEDIYYEEDK